jgi:penicillin-binding protein 1B
MVFMQKRSSSKTSSRSSLKTKKNSNLIARLLQLMIIAACVGAGYVLWLDYRIHSEFEGRKWTIPARVYARPMDIYLGQNLLREQVERSLMANFYQLVPELSGPGQYRRHTDGIEIFLRAFDYWDGHISAAHYRLTFSAGKVHHIEALASGALTPVIRLEPELIGKIYPDHNEDRNLIGSDDVPVFLIEALIAVEDQNFYSHFGLDFRGIFRAFWVNFRSGEIAQGGSTLTQQLVKNFFLTEERTFSRKVNEMIMAVLLEQRYSKQQILHAYLNEVYLGQNGAQSIHGFGTAAEFYFNKPLQELREDQLALLVALARGASFYNPQRNPERALERRNLVLRLMAEQSYLDQQKLATFQKRPLDIAVSPGRSQLRYGSLIDLARRQLLQNYKLEDLKNEGLRIYTTLDPAIQNKLEESIERRVADLESGRKLAAGTLESATVIVNISNGEVLAISGSRYTHLAGFNRALDAKRQVGSLLKPFVYLTALSNPAQYNLLSVIEDTAISLKQSDGSIWQPGNYDKVFHGSVSLIESLANSYNLATVRLGMNIGLDKVMNTLVRAGMTTRANAFPSMLLGAVDLSPFEVTQMYQTIANGGFRVPLNVIREVLDSEGKPLQRRELNIVQALDSQAVFLTNYLLTKAVEVGTARQLSRYFESNHILAGKTGTTNESRDSWFAGYDDELLTVNWLGRDDNQPTPFTGASGAMQIWADIMRSISTRPLELFAPDTITWTDEQEIRFTGDCVNIGKVPFVANNMPENKLTCQALSDSVRSRFNPLNWFN